MKAIFRAFLLLVGVAIVGGGVAAYAIASRGPSTRVAASAIETSIALTMRRFATPSAARGAANPVPATPEELDEVLVHLHEEEEARRLLAGDDAPAPPAPQPAHKHE